MKTRGAKQTCCKARSQNWITNAPYISFFLQLLHTVRHRPCMHKCRRCFAKGIKFSAKRKRYATVVQRSLRRQMKLLETQGKKGKTICECYRETPGIQNMIAINEWLLLGRLRLEPAHRSIRSVNRVSENVWLCMY